MSVAVAIHRHVVHYIYVDNPSAHVVVYALSGGSHRLQEVVLSGTGSKVFGPPSLGGIIRLAGCVNIGFSGSGCNTDGGILQHAAEATHGMTFKMGQINHVVIICQMAAHDVVFQVLAVLHGNTYLVVFVHDVNCKDGVETVLVNGLPML